MQPEPLRLPILLIPPQIQPVQPFEDGIERSLRVALDIGVVNPQDHGAALVARIEPVEDERARAPYVQKSSGRRCKPYAKHGKTQYNKVVSGGTALRALAGPRVTISLSEAAIYAWL